MLHTALGKGSHYPPGNHHAIATSKNVLIPGHNHLLTIGTNNHWHLGDNQSEGSSVPVVSRWLGLEIQHF